MSSFTHPFSIASQTASLSAKTSTSAVDVTASAALPTSIAAAAASASNTSAIDMSTETLRLLQAGGHIPPPQFAFPPPGLGGPPQMAPNPLDVVHRLGGGIGPFGLFPMPPEFKGDAGLPPHLLGHPGMPPQPLPGYYYDPMSPFPGPYNPYGGPLDLNGARRKNATRETTAALKAWLYEHRKNPYPTKGEKVMLAIITKMTLTQVSTWFANARRRLKKENKMTWSPRNRPGEDDDDDDIGAGDRPTSSMSDESDLAPPSHMQHPPAHLQHQHGATINLAADAVGRTENNNNEVTNGRADVGKPIAAEKRQTDKPSADEPVVKKRKIWSIADTVASADSNNGTGEVSPTTSSDSKKSVVPPTTSLVPPTTSIGGASPMHFAFNSWQQAALKSPLMSPNALSPGSAAGQFRPELFLNRPGVAPGMPPFSFGATFPCSPAAFPSALAGFLGQAFNPRAAMLFNSPPTAATLAAMMNGTMTPTVSQAPADRVRNNSSKTDVRDEKPSSRASSTANAPTAIEAVTPPVDASTEQ